MERLFFSRSARVRRQCDFDRVFAARKYAADHVLVVRGVLNGMDKPRLGLSISRKVGNAVVRNRWKRLIREAFRTSQRQLPPGVDFVVLPRKGALPDHAAILRSLPRLAARVEKQLRVKSS